MIGLDSWQDAGDQSDDAQLLFWPILSGGVVLGCLMSVIALLVMMPHDDDEASNKDDFRQRRTSQRFRSLSASVDFHFTDYINQWGTTSPGGALAKSGWERQQLRVLSGTSDRYRTMSTNYIERYRLLHHAECADLTSWKLRGLEMLRRVPEAFPFQSLPVDCRMMVFSYLSGPERGTAAQVCRDWRNLMREPTLWKEVDFTSFAFCQRCAIVGAVCTPLCYAGYKARMKAFFRFLFEIRPTIHRLRAAFDIGDQRDGWGDLLQELLRVARCQELAVVDIDWKETPAKPLVFNSGQHATWSTGDFYDVMFNHRYRQRLFVRFFDMLVAAAPNITNLSIPFDWSDRSVRAIGRLHRLRTLTLKQYFWMQCVDPPLVEELIASATKLQTLSLEIWSTNSQGLQSYVIRSETVEHLDVSACRGFCLGDVHLPRLRSVDVSRHPLSGPLSTEVTGYSARCLLNIFLDGAPVLESINGYRLVSGWRDAVGLNDNEELEKLLRKICACTVHKPS